MMCVTEEYYSVHHSKGENELRSVPEVAHQEVGRLVGRHSHLDPGL